ncbi:hypothetical protein GCM10025872_36230 [Barrientosiimonas endolithica]|uniref:Uncharacterized protein n=1 Tax=Barrientosiimonas endolithica TaxID=1535208 RepID=A0ABN6YSS6_9MICO|nr:hypothetical protein [Barrientosiimonas endolithica]BDZ59966.1 hypothetical protein GCM10025872_36230 [Barrientosiimonas endolithica]
MDERFVPDVVGEVEDVAAAAERAGAADHLDLLEIAHRAGDRRRARVQQLGQLGGGELALVGDDQRGEDPRGHAVHAAAGELLGQLLQHPAARCVGAAAACHGDDGATARVKDLNR